MKGILAFVVSMAAMLYADAAGSASGANSETAADWTVPRAFNGSGGHVLLYRWMEPAKVEAGRVYPLVVLLHGAGERGTNNVSQLQWGATPVLAYMRANRIDGYFIAGQVPSGQRWVDTPWDAMSHRMSETPSVSMSLLLELVDKTIAERPVDRSRVYVTGVSMGGYGTWDAVQRRPELFAAAIPVCGGGDTHLAWKIRDVPIWAWHGDKDNVVVPSRSRDMVAALWAVDGRIRYTEVPGCGHGVWNYAYASQEALKWLFDQRR